MQGQNQEEDPGDESFYSIKSNHSRFEDGDPLQVGLYPIPEVQASKEQTPSLHIAQSSLRFDQSAPALSSHNSDNRSGRSREPSSMVTIPNGRTASVKGLINECDMSIIENNRAIQQAEQLSMSILNQIESLKFDEVSPEELKEIHKKINTLKSEQMTLQGSLRLATSMLQASKARNEIMEKQLQQYRQVYSSPTKFEKKAFAATLTTTPKSADIEYRSFPQSNQKSVASGLNKQLKYLYRECSLRPSVCLIRNSLYEFSVQYYRGRNKQGQDSLIVSVWLKPFPHVVNKRQNKFWVGLCQDSEEISAQPELNFQGGQSEKQFSAWPNQKTVLTAIIIETDHSGKNPATSEVVIPLPITHFLEPRLQKFDPPLKDRVRQAMSRYQTELKGNMVSEQWVGRLRECWWMSSQELFSCLGWNELVEVSIESGEGHRVSIWGRKNSKVVVGLMEYVTFFMME